MEKEMVKLFNNKLNHRRHYQPRLTTHGRNVKTSSWSESPHKKFGFKMHLLVCFPVLESDAPNLGRNSNLWQNLEYATASSKEQAMKLDTFSSVHTKAIHYQPALAKSW
jgi:hypothetical protein